MASSPSPPSPSLRLRSKSESNVLEPGEEDGETSPMGASYSKDVCVQRAAQHLKARPSAGPLVAAGGAGLGARVTALPPLRTRPGIAHGNLDRATTSAQPPPEEGPAVPAPTVIPSAARRSQSDRVRGGRRRASRKKQKSSKFKSASLRDPVPHHQPTPPHQVPDLQDRRNFQQVFDMLMRVCTPGHWAHLEPLLRLMAGARRTPLNINDAINHILCMPACLTSELDDFVTITVLSVLQELVAEEAGGAAPGAELDPDDKALSARGNVQEHILRALVVGFYRTMPSSPGASPSATAPLPTRGRLTRSLSEGFLAHVPFYANLSARSPNPQPKSSAAAISPDLPMGEKLKGSHKVVRVQSPHFSATDLRRPLEMARNSGSPASDKVAATAVDLDGSASPDLQGGFDYWASDTGSSSSTSTTASFVSASEDAWWMDDEASSTTGDDASTALRVATGGVFRMRVYGDEDGDDDDDRDDHGSFFADKLPLTRTPSRSWTSPTALDVLAASGFPETSYGTAEEPWDSPTSPDLPYVMVNTVHDPPAVGDLPDGSRAAPAAASTHHHVVEVSEAAAVDAGDDLEGRTVVATNGGPKGHAYGLVGGGNRVPNDGSSPRLVAAGNAKPFVPLVRRRGHEEVGAAIPTHLRIVLPGGEERATNTAAEGVPSSAPPIVRRLDGVDRGGRHGKPQPAASKPNVGERAGATETDPHTPNGAVSSGKRDDATVPAAAATNGSSGGRVKFQPPPPIVAVPSGSGPRPALPAVKVSLTPSPTGRNSGEGRMGFGAGPEPIPGDLTSGRVRSGSYGRESGPPHVRVSTSTVKAGLGRDTETPPPVAAAETRMGSDNLGPLRPPAVLSVSSPDLRSQVEAARQEVDGTLSPRSSRLKKSRSHVHKLASEATLVPPPATTRRRHRKTMSDSSAIPLPASITSHPSPPPPLHRVRAVKPPPLLSINTATDTAGTSSRPPLRSRSKKKKRKMGLTLDLGAAKKRPDDFIDKPNGFYDLKYGMMYTLYGTVPIADKSDEEREELLAQLDSSTVEEALSTLSTVAAPPPSLQSFTTTVGGLSQSSGFSAQRSKNFGDFEELNVIGYSVDGPSVYKVRDLETGEVFAKKRVRLVCRDRQRLQLAREVRILYYCKCPEIVTFYNAIFYNSEIHIYMEFMDLGSLASLLAMTRRAKQDVPTPVIALVARAVLRGLAYLEERNIMHRDIKPGNILINSTGDIKICDMGISTYMNTSSNPPSATTPCGTLLYRAPERSPMYNDSPDHSYTATGDVWSLGLVLLELAIGQLPYTDHWDLAERVFDEDERPATNIPDGSRPPAFVDFVDQCLTRDPVARPYASNMLDHPFVAGLETPVAAAAVDDAFAFSPTGTGSSQPTAGPSSAGSPATTPGGSPAFDLIAWLSELLSVRGVSDVLPDHADGVRFIQARTNAFPTV